MLFVLQKREVRLAVLSHEKEALAREQRDAMRKRLAEETVKQVLARHCIVFGVINV